MKEIRILITGVTGFVGGHLVRALTEDPGPFAISGTTYPEPPPAGNPAFRRIDLRSEEDIFSLVRDHRPDWIVHLAAVSNVRNAWGIRRETLETNILGTHNLLEAVRREVPTARVLFVSSSDVYGSSSSQDSALTETAPFRVMNPYAYSKAASEMLCGFYAGVENLDIVVARPFPHTGPGQAAQFVCSDWARQIVMIERGGTAPTLRVGNLDVRRDFCDVRDVVKAYVALLRKGRRGETYNVCTGKAVALRDILDFLIGEARVSGSISIETDPDKLRKTDAPLLVGSNAKIVGETGWTPGLPIERTLRDLLDFWRGR